MEDELTLNHNALILDACCIINLYASQRPEEILRALPTKPVVVAEAVTEETLGVFDGPSDNIRQRSRLIEFQSLVAAGLLTIMPLGEAEEILYVNLSARLDHGEAASMALAIARSWAIATDDRRAASTLQQQAPHIQRITTLDMLRHWSIRVGATHAQVAEVLGAVQRYGFYRPPPTHPLYPWWRDHV